MSWLKAIWAARVALGRVNAVQNEMETYTDAAKEEALETAQAKGKLPEGLERLLAELNEKLSANYRKDFEKQWSARTAGIERIGSFSVRFRLDEEMHVTEAALASVNMGK